MCILFKTPLQALFRPQGGGGGGEGTLYVKWTGVRSSQNVPFLRKIIVVV